MSDAGLEFPGEIEYDVCRKCYYVFRGPEELKEQASQAACKAAKEAPALQFCRNPKCRRERKKCLKFIYR